MAKTTNDIIMDAWNGGKLLEATKYVCSTDFKKNQNTLWFSQEEVNNIISSDRSELNAIHRGEIENLIMNQSVDVMEGLNDKYRVALEQLKKELKDKFHFTTDRVEHFKDSTEDRIIGVYALFFEFNKEIDAVFAKFEKGD